jgi:hypothetical protein
MQNLRALLALGVCVSAVAVACGSSSSNPGTSTTPDAAATDDSTTPITESDDSSAATTCVPIGTVGCSMGQECCLDLSAGLAPGNCVAAGACSGGIDIGCEKAADCTGNQVCCASFGGADGGTLQALLDGGLAALGIDASSISLDAGAAGLGGLGALGNVSFAVKCAASCSGSQIQACASDTECAGGAACVPITALLGDGGALGDAGIPASFATYAGMLGMVKACVPPTPDGGMMSTVPDSGVVDAVAPVDAPADAVSE